MSEPQESLPSETGPDAAEPQLKSAGLGWILMPLFAVLFLGLGFVSLMLEMVAHLRGVGRGWVESFRCGEDLLLCRAHDWTATAGGVFLILFALCCLGLLLAHVWRRRRSPSG